MAPSTQRRSLSLCGWTVLLALPWTTRQGDSYSLLRPQQQHQRIAASTSTTPPAANTMTPNRNSNDPQEQLQPLRTRTKRIRRVSQLAMVGQVYGTTPRSVHHHHRSSSNGKAAPSDNVNDLIYAVPKPTFSPIEVLCLVRIEQWYEIALSHKCPFLRRRMTDFMDTLEMLVRDVLIRKKNLALVGPPVGCRGDERTRHKTKGLTLDQRAAVIRNDWKEDTQKGYYVTGRLTPAIYRDDCFFDGPDPDMPVRGLRKFLNAASQLFDPKQSRCELLSLTTTTTNNNDDVVVARWRMNGVLRLPWRPRMPEVVGETIYHFDDDGLVERHEETWDLSAVEAFLKTSWFDFRAMASHSYSPNEGKVPI